MRKSPVNRGSSRLVRALRSVLRGPSVKRKTATFRRGRLVRRPEAFLTLTSGTAAATWIRTPPSGTS